MQKPSIQTFTQSNNNIKWYFFAGGLVVIASLFGLIISSVSIPVQSIIAILLHKILSFENTTAFTSTQELIIWQIRLPRVLLGLLVGASLSIAGAALQGILRNPLAEPYTIGVSSGASLGAVLVISFKWSLFGMGLLMTLPIIAVFGALISMIIVLAIARLNHFSMNNESIILSGIILTSFVSAIITLLISLSKTQDMSAILYWMMGHLGMKDWQQVGLILPFFIIGSTILLLKSKVLNALTMGDSSASQIGVDVKKEKFLILLAVGLLTGSAVAVTGMIGFVGLVIPHFIRLVVGSNHKLVLPLSLLIGSSYLTIADVIARTIIEPKELPIGVITAIIGAPVFTWLLIRQRSKGGNRNA